MILALRRSSGASLKESGAPALFSRMDERAQAIERVYRERYGAFRNLAAAVTGNYDSAHDAVQEGFARALARRRQLRGQDAVQAWVLRIVLRAALEGRNGTVIARVEDIEAALPQPERDPELADALRSLPPRRRLIVFLRHVADLSYADIAALCDISEGTVAATLAQARAQLQAELERKEVAQ